MMSQQRVLLMIFSALACMGKISAMDALPNWDTDFHVEEEDYLRAAEDDDLNEELLPKKSYVGYRTYSKGYSEADKKEIRYIMKILATKSLASLWGYKSDLEKAGDKIDQVHPLRFLECIFTDEELKAYIHGIKKRGSWIWTEFFKGIKGSLHDEVNLDNLKDEYIIDFSHRVNIDVNDIYSFIQARMWDDFVKILIIKIPREGDSGRHDQ